MTVALSIKNVPDELARRLKERAARNHRSLQGELMAIIEAAVAEPGPSDSARSATRIERGQVIRRGWMTAEQIAAERFAKYPVRHDIALGVDIIRKERDSR